MTRTPSPHKRNLSESSPISNSSSDAAQRLLVGLVQQISPPHESDWLGTHFPDNGRLTPLEQIEIYRRQYWLRHIDALTEDFPGLLGLLGDEAWHQLATSYLDKSPPTGFTLRNLGRQLPTYLRAQSALDFELEPARARTLIDMAELECAYLRAFDAPDLASISAESLAEIPAESWNEARLILHPSVSLLELSGPLVDLRRIFRKSTHSRQNSGWNLVPPPTTEWTAVYRHHDLTLYDKRLTAQVFLLLHSLQTGATLGVACETLLRSFPDHLEFIKEHLGDWFAMFGRLGWIADVKLEKYHGDNQGRATKKVEPQQTSKG